MRRLCCVSRDAIVCNECDLCYYCRACAKRAKCDGEAPCKHCCSQCLRQGELFWCDECQEGSKGAALTASAAAASSRRASTAATASTTTATSAASARLLTARSAGLAVATCAGASDHMLRVLLRAAKFVHCRGTTEYCAKEELCQHCAPDVLHTVNGVPLCDACIGSSDEEDAEEDAAAA